MAALYGGALFVLPVHLARNRSRGRLTRKARIAGSGWRPNFWVLSFKKGRLFSFFLLGFSANPQVFLVFFFLCLLVSFGASVVWACIFSLIGVGSEVPKGAARCVEILTVIMPFARPSSSGSGLLQLRFFCLVIPFLTLLLAVDRFLSPF